MDKRNTETSQWRVEESQMSVEGSQRGQQRVEGSQGGSMAARGWLRRDREG